VAVFSFEAGHRHGRFAMHLLSPQKKKHHLAVLHFPLERVRGIEPLSSVWKTEIITIIRYPQTGDNGQVIILVGRLCRHFRFCSHPFGVSRKLVGNPGLEPGTSRSQTECSSQLSQFPYTLSQGLVNTREVYPKYQF
jgi:hypothetical protein